MNYFNNHIELKKISNFLTSFKRKRGDIKYANYTKRLFQRDKKNI